MVEQSDKIKEQRRRMQSSLLEKQKEARTTHSKKSVPQTVVSAKFIMQEKKNVRVIDDSGKEISMDEMLARSKEG